MTKNDDGEFAFSDNGFDGWRLAPSKEGAIADVLEEASSRPPGRYAYYIGAAYSYDAHERYVRRFDASLIYDTLADAACDEVEDPDCYPDIKKEHLELAAQQVQAIILAVLKEHAHPSSFFEVPEHEAIDVLIVDGLPPSWSPRATVPATDDKPCPFKIGDKVRVIATRDQLHEFFHWEQDEDCYDPGMEFTIAEIEDGLISPSEDHPAPIGFELLEPVE